MSILFGVDISRISRHIKKALNEEEINSQRNLRKTQIANSDKLVYLYDLDVIISVGYRVKSVISRHIKNILFSYELNVNSVVAKNATTAKEDQGVILLIMFN